MKMVVTGIQGETDATTLGDIGPTFIDVRIDLECKYGSSWFVVPLDKSKEIHIGDLYEVEHGKIEKVADV